MPRQPQRRPVIRHAGSRRFGSLGQGGTGLGGSNVPIWRWDFTYNADRTIATMHCHNQFGVLLFTLTFAYNADRTILSIVRT